VKAEGAGEKEGAEEGEGAEEEEGAVGARTHPLSIQGPMVVLASGYTLCTAMAMTCADVCRIFSSSSLSFVGSSIKRSCSGVRGSAFSLAVAVVEEYSRVRRGAMRLLIVKPRFTLSAADQERSSMVPKIRTAQRWRVVETGIGR
jgi:hypothetical protein